MTKKFSALEDEQIYRELYGRAPEEAGYEVTIEEDGKKRFDSGPKRPIRYSVT